MGEKVPKKLLTASTFMNYLNAEFFCYKAKRIADKTA